MANMFGVAKCITERLGPLSAMKLQKLMYYCQCWSLVWDEEPLFEEDFQAWANGPVLPDLYVHHRGQFKVDASSFASFDLSSITAPQMETIEAVLGFYGDKTAQWLSDLTHQEAPWVNARGDLAPGEKSTVVIAKSDMHEYYSSL